MLNTQQMLPFSNLSITLPTSQLILQPFCSFTYITAFSNPSIASCTLQFILQPFFCFSYVTSSSLNSPGKLPMNVTQYLMVYRKVHLVHGCANHDTEGKRFKSPIHCCDVMKPPYFISGELCTFPCTVNSCLCTSCAVGATGQCFSVFRTRNSDVILTLWTAVVGEVTSPSSDTICHSCSPVE